MTSSEQYLKESPVPFWGEKRIIAPGYYTRKYRMPIKVLGFKSYAIFFGITFYFSQSSVTHLFLCQLLKDWLLLTWGWIFIQVPVSLSSKFFSVHNWIGHFRVSKHQLLIKIIYRGISFVSIQIGSQILSMVIQVYPQLTLNNDVMARGSEGVLIKFL